MIKKLKKLKKKSLSLLKRKAWKEFSLWIRLKDSDPDGFNVCVTCGVRRYYTELQAGHFLAGRTNGILFDERGVYPQCVRCNIFLRGNVEEYYPFMLEKHGQEVIDELKRKKKQLLKYSREDYEDMIKKFSDLSLRRKSELRI